MALQEPMQDPQDRVRRTIAAVLAGKGMKPKELALMIGMHPQHLYKRLRGETTISVKDIATIAEALDKPVEEFFRGEVKFRWSSERPERHLHLVT